MACWVTALAGGLAACGGKAGSNEATGGSAGSVATGGAVSSGGSAAAGAPHGGASGTAGAAGNDGRSGAGGNAATGGGGAAGSGGVSSGGVSSGGAAGAAGSAPTAAALTPTVNAFCAAARSCCAQQGEPAMLDDCESAFATKNSVAGSLASGAITVDATALAACRAAYEAAATSCEENAVLKACRGVTLGTVAEGAPCTNGTECAAKPGPSTCLITAPNGTVGVCSSVVHAASGQSCSFTCRAGDDCRSTTYDTTGAKLALCFEDEGLYCDATEQHCKALTPIGGACTGNDQCGINAFCSTTCQKRGTLGQACLPCLDSLMCVDNKCVSPPFASFATCEGRSLGPY